MINESIGAAKINEKRVEQAINAMSDAMMEVPGITVPEMVSAALRLMGRTCKVTLQQSADGTLLRNQEVLRECLQQVMLDAVSDNRGQVM